MHGCLGNFPEAPEATISWSLGCVILFSLLGFAVSATVLAMAAPQSFDEILAMLG